MIEKAKTRDGEKSESFIHTVRGPGSHVEVQKGKKTIGNNTTKESALVEA